MTQNWKDIWNRRSLGSEEVGLDSLIKSDGFDTGAVRIEADDWQRIQRNEHTKRIQLYHVQCICQ